MNIDKLNEAEAFYNEKIKGWMLGDLKKSIDAKANFLTALGCLVYTEIFGIMLPPLNEKDKNSKSNKFYRSLFRFKSGDFLKVFNKDVKNDTNKGLYEHLRHSMAHSYLPTIHRKRNGQSEFISTTIAKKGYQTNETTKEREPAPPLFIGGDHRGYTLVIATSNYLNELEQLVNESFSKTFEDKDTSYQLAAIKGIDFIKRKIT